jgi:hypothetical protein
MLPIWLGISERLAPNSAIFTVTGAIFTVITGTRGANTSHF